MGFFDDGYLLDSREAREIYEAIRELPIYDYHSHLDPRAIYEDKVYSDIGSLWLGHDHYKWRLMRQAGVSERYITGDSTREDKFRAFASIMPYFVGNSVYEWAHMELKHYFDIDIPLCKDNAGYIWKRTNEMIKDRGYSPRTLLNMANVDTLMTTDDPIDDLEYHRRLHAERYKVGVVPTFRPDKVMDISSHDFLAYINRLSSLTDIDIHDITSLVTALEKRLIYFMENGCVISDISMMDIPPTASRSSADEVLGRALNGDELTYGDVSKYEFTMLLELGRLYSKYDIVMQLHIGAIRNQCSRLYRDIGGDSGIDSIADAPSIYNLGRYLDMLDRDSTLPRMIVYTHNEYAYMGVSTMLGNFAGERIGKLQLGNAWWMNDSKAGISRQIDCFCNTMGIGYFNGMLTDSRSFTSFVRHDYFRRILSSRLGDLVRGGGAILDDVIVVARDVAYYNAKEYFDKGGNEV